MSSYRPTRVATPTEAREALARRGKWPGIDGARQFARPVSAGARTVAQVETEIRERIYQLHRRTGEPFTSLWRRFVG